MDSLLASTKFTRLSAVISRGLPFMALKKRTGAQINRHNCSLHLSPQETSASYMSQLPLILLCKEAASGDLTLGVLRQIMGKDSAHPGLTEYRCLCGTHNRFTAAGPLRFSGPWLTKSAVVIPNYFLNSGAALYNRNIM